MDEMDYMMHDHDPSTPHSQQPQPRPQPHQSGCPYWREQATRSSPNRHLPSHPQYDPVNNLFFSQPAPSLPWAPPGGPGGPGPATHPPARHPRSSSESFYPQGTAGGPGASAAAQASLMHNYGGDPFGSFPFAFRHPSAMQRFGPPPPPPAQPNHPASHQMSFPPERSRDPHSTSRILPPLNPPQPAQQQPNMSSSGESSPAAAAGPPSRPPFTTSTGSMLGLLEPPLTSPYASAPEAARTEPSQSHDLTSTATGDADSAASLPATPPAPPNTERRRHASTRPAQPSARLSNRSVMAYDSDDESDFQDIPEDEQQALRFIEQQISAGTANPLRVGDMEEARIRAHQLLRGQLSSKRVASRGALSSLQSVDLTSLPESERMCVICYNEFGIPNPEGINEAPLRLPRCKHVFGDHCIKKWFEESDSCPYCRDKVPSEPQIRVTNYGALSEFLRNSYAPRSGARPHVESRGSASTVTLIRGDADAYVRLMAQRGESQYDGSPPQAWHTGERRSPPSEGLEPRRRTRPRHANSRALSSNNAPSNGRPSSFAGTAPSASLQQSPGRERFPSGNHRPYNYNGGGAARHLPPMMPLDMEPLAFGLPPMSNPGPAGFMPPPLANPGSHEQAYPGHLNGGPGMPHPQTAGGPMGAHFPRVQGMPAYYPDFHPAHPMMEGPDYSTGPNGNSHHPTPAGEFY